MAKRLLSCVLGLALFSSLALLDQSGLFVARLMAAVAIGTPLNGLEQQATNPYTTVGSITIGAGDVILCGTSIHRGPGLADTVTAMAYDPTGVNEALSLIRADTHGTDRPRTEWWFRGNPTAGTHPVKVTLSAAVDNLTYCYPISGAATTTDASNGATGTSTAPSAAVTTVADNSWTFAVLNVSSNATVSGASDTQDLNQDFGQVNGQATFQHFGPKTPAGSKTMNWTLAVPDGWAISLISIKPAAGGAAAAAPRMLLLGLP